MSNGMAAAVKNELLIKVNDSDNTLAKEMYLVRTVVAVVTIILWMTFFLIGVFVSSGGYTNRLANTSGYGLLSILWTGVAAIGTWTWTNVIALSVLSGIIGEVLRWNDQYKKHRSNADYPNYRGAIIRGYFITLLLLSGHLVLAGGAIESIINQPYYFRVASTISLLSFLVNYNPQILALIIKRFEEMAGNRVKDIEWESHAKRAEESEVEDGRA